MTEVVQKVYNAQTDLNEKLKAAKSETELSFKAYILALHDVLRTQPDFENYGSVRFVNPWGYAHGSDSTNLEVTGESLRIIDTTKDSSRRVIHEIHGPEKIMEYVKTELKSGFQTQRFGQALNTLNKEEVNFQVNNNNVKFYMEKLKE